MSTRLIKIIAEIGINHNGSIDEATRLIEASHKAGVDGVKFQYRNIKNIYSSSNEIGDEMLLAELQRTDMKAEDIINLSRYAHSLSLEVGISFFCIEDMEDFKLDKGIFDFYKVPSAELSNERLIDAMLKTNRHVYISTGCHREDEVEKALNRLPDNGWTPCTVYQTIQQQWAIADLAICLI